MCHHFSEPKLWLRPRGEEAYFYSGMAAELCGRYERNPEKSTMKKVLNYIDKAVEAQGGEYDWYLIEMKVEMLMCDNKIDEAYEFARSQDTQRFCFPYQREMYFNIFRAIKAPDNEKRKFYIANRMPY